MADETKGKDNNKRLALLEGGVASLAAVLGELGVTVAEGADPIVLVIELAKGQATTIDELEKNASEAAIAAIARAEKAEARVADLEKKIEELCLTISDQAAELVRLNSDIEQLEGHIEALQSAGDDAEGVEVAPARERPENARDFGPTFGELDRVDLVELFGNGDVGLEISFSNGDYELVELAPVAIKASDLVTAEGRFMAPTIHVRGGEHDEALHGASLVHEGSQIAYCAFPSPIALGRKQERRFEKVISFG
jgi:uncharacterized coiled-coil protein SlyX